MKKLVNSTSLAFTSPAPSQTGQDSGKIHPTALLVVEKRSANIVATHVRKSLEHEISTNTINLGNTTIGRVTGVLVDTRFAAINKVINDMFMRSGLLNTLELACGYSYRVFENLPVQESIVTDLETSIAGIHQIYNQIILENGNLRPKTAVNFLGINALTDSLLDKVYFKTERPVAIVTEGLLPYLNRDQLKALTWNIKDYLRKSPKGSAWITTDLLFTHVIRSLNGDKIIDRVSQSTGTNLNKNSFDLLEEFVEFMGDLGMRVEAIGLNDIVDHTQFASYRTLLKNQEINPKDITFINDILRELHVLKISTTGSTH